MNLSIITTTLNIKSGIDLSRDSSIHEYRMHFCYIFEAASRCLMASVNLTSTS